MQGFSTSMPEDVQIEMLHSVKGLENAKMMRTAYAIEYDCCDSTMLKSTLEFKDYSGLFGAGQFNGSSGYEEAAAQGLIAGINAVRKIENKSDFVLDRSDSYIGTLIDDLTTKGTNEPYRMMTSRSEYRVLLRQDNADLRLTEKGHEIGLISEERYKKFVEKRTSIENEIQRVENTNIGPTEAVLELLKKHGSTPIKSGIKLGELVRRPELSYDILKPIDKNRPELDKYVCQEVNIQIKYDGYISTLIEQGEKFKKLENRLIPSDIDYNLIKGLRLEAIEKLDKIRPKSVGQASRITGVSPSDMNVLLIYLQANK